MSPKTANNLPQHAMNLSKTASSLSTTANRINRNWVILIPLCIACFNLRNLRSLQRSSFNYLAARRINIMPTAAITPLRKDAVLQPNTCMTKNECDDARRQLGLIGFELGNSSQYGCFSKGEVAYWGEPKSSLHIKEMSSQLDNNMDRIYCNHKRTKNALGVAWLMSFPNSGTSYTGALVRNTTSIVTATNYGTANTMNKKSTPLFNFSTNGPFLTDPKTFFKGKLNLPSSKNGTYILTKTHCGGYCFGCSPKAYLQTQAQFRDDCLTGDFLDAFGGKQKAMYDASIVNKAVHLVRDPFDNIVSRFHLKRNQKQKQGNETWLNSYPNTIDGFRGFCSYVNTRLNNAENNFAVIGKGNNNENVFVKYREKIPCYSDFVRFVLWHNHAIETIDELGLESMTLHYEDYSNNYKETTTKLFQFLGMVVENNSEEYEFHGTERYYRNYFTSDEVEAVKELVKDVAIKENWNMLSRYFD